MLKKTYDRTASDRSARLREKRRAEGFVQVTVMVPVDRADELKAVAAKMREAAKKER